MSLEHPVGQPEELGALFAAGAMSEDERLVFLDHLANGCPECARHLVGCLDVLQPAAETRLRVLRGRLLDRVTSDLQDHAGQAAPSNVLGEEESATDEIGARSQPTESSGVASGCYILPAEAGSWVPTDYEGIQIRRLYVDRERGQFTALVRMDAGATFPPHQHDAAEECLVLEGELHFGDKVLRTGDFLRTGPGYRQEEQWTPEGCLLYLTSPIE